jgi:UDP-glucose 4-epimerase
VAAAVGVRPDVRHGPARPGDVPDSQADAGRLRQLFPQVQPVRLEEGLETTVAWFRQSAAQAAGPLTSAIAPGPAAIGG